MEVCKPIPAMHLVQLQSRNSDVAEGPATVLPWWTLSQNRPFMPLHKEPEGKHLDSNLGEFESKEVQKEGSWTDSNTSSVSDGENNEKPDYQAKNTHVHRCQLDHTTPSETSTISEPRVRPKTWGKGFVPYKRCMSNRENHYYSPVTGEKREEQRIKLSL